MAASRFATFLESFDRDPKTRGTQWEHVCKWFLETDPVYRTQLKKVWLWNKESSTRSSRVRTPFRGGDTRATIGKGGLSVSNDP